VKNLKRAYVFLQSIEKLRLVFITDKRIVAAKDNRQLTSYIRLSRAKQLFKDKHSKFSIRSSLASTQLAGSALADRHTVSPASLVYCVMSRDYEK